MKADQRRLRQSLRQTESRTKEARRARRLIFVRWRFKEFSHFANADPPVYRDTEIKKLECCGHVQKRTGKRLIAKVNELKGKQFKEENFMPRQVAIPNAGCVGERSHHILMSLITKTMSSDDTTQLVNRCLTPPLLHSSGSCKPIIALGGEPTSHTCIQCSLPHVPPETTPAPHRIMSYQASVQAQ
ncbi:hypothetical protein NP493_246g02029 [Ridgeia piscesae]|uniref:Uncharacterized protein n=1 Tax=Ridgeia piscesae TaxID=27915 RepID=A0AAD9UDA6_RIDPI|nr:hypothetical protein NP493_246g02029 [Ridgeia piscesae]